MVHLRLGHSFLAALFLLPAALGFLAMLTIALTQRSGLAAGGALLFLGIGGQLLRMLRRRQQDAPEAVVHRGAQGAVATSLPAFVTFARHSRGPWTQKGVVVVGDGCAVFLPMGGPSHLALDIVMTLAGPSLRFADIGIDLGGTTPAAMAAAAEEHGGFLLTSDWTWHASQRWLRRHEADGIVVLEKAPQRSA